MRTEQLRYFIEVAQTNSLTKAAEKLFIAPQSLSESITRLENEFGVRLFFRTSSGMRLTEVGEVFLEHAYAMLAEYERTIEHLRYFQQSQPLRLCTNSYITTAMLPQILQSYYQLEQHNSLLTFEVASVEVCRQVAEQHADVGLSAISTMLFQQSSSIRHFLQTTLNYLELFTDTFYVIVNKHSPLATKTNISMDEVLKHPLITDSYNTMQTLLNSFHFTPVQPLLNISTQAAITQIIENQMAVALIPTFSAKHYLSNNIVALHVTDGPSLSVGIFWHQQSSRLEEIAAFIELMQSLYSPKSLS